MVTCTLIDSFNEIIGLITEAECEAYDAIKSDNSKYWIPIRWAMNVLNTARAEKRIANDFLFDKIFEVSSLRSHILTV